MEPQPLTPKWGEGRRIDSQTMYQFSRNLYPAYVSSKVPISPEETDARQLRQERNIYRVEPPMRSSSSSRSGIDLRFAMSLLTELDGSKELAINISLLAELEALQRHRFKSNSQPRCMIWVMSLHKAG
jgi:hypothetical protein